MSGDNAPALEWTVRLSSESPQKAAAVYFFAGVSFLLGILFVNIFVGLIGALLVLGGTAEFWLPVKYRLDEEGGTCKCGLSVTAIEWNRVKRVVLSDDGIKLSPLVAQTRSAPFRGVFLRFDGDGSAILNFIRERVPDVDYVERRPDGGGDSTVAGESGFGDSEAQNGDSGSPIA